MLELRSFLVKEHVGMFRLTDTYDIFDPQSGQQVGIAREEVGGFTRYARLLLSKKLMPTRVVVREVGTEKEVLSIRRGVAFFRPRVEIYNAEGTKIGYFQSKAFSLGGAFRVFDANDREFAIVQGTWTSWTFTFKTTDGIEIGVVSKKWAGLGKEFFTTADNYIISMNEDAPEGEITAMLMLAAGLAIDTVLKETG
jgi:uncharacterized protein YxjI